MLGIENVFHCSLVRVVCVRRREHHFRIPPFKPQLPDSRFRHIWRNGCLRFDRRRDRVFTEFLQLDFDRHLSRFPVVAAILCVSHRRRERRVNRRFGLPVGQLRERIERERLQRPRIAHPSFLRHRPHHFHQEERKPTQ